MWSGPYHQESTYLHINHSWKQNTMVCDFFSTSHPACLSLTHNNSNRARLVTTLLQPNSKVLLLSRYSLVAEEDPRTKNFLCCCKRSILCLSAQWQNFWVWATTALHTSQQLASEFTPASHHSATHYFHSGTTRPQYSSLKLIKHKKQFKKIYKHNHTPSGKKWWPKCRW